MLGNFRRHRLIILQQKYTKMFESRVDFLLLGLARKMLSPDKRVREVCRASVTRIRLIKITKKQQQRHTLSFVK